MEIWLDWQAHQLDMSCWWRELAAIPGVEDPWKLTQEDPGLLPDSQGQKQGLPGARLYCTHAPKCLTQNVFLLDELSYQDVQQQPFLLTVAYAQGVAVLGRETQSAREPRFLPLGEKCH